MSPVVGQSIGAPAMRSALTSGRASVIGAGPARLEFVDQQTELVGQVTLFGWSAMRCSFGTGEVGSCGPTEMRAGQIHSPKVRCIQMGFLQVRCIQMGFLQVRFGEVSLSEECSLEMGVWQLCLAKVGIAKIQFRSAWGRW
jgi:hypothetical protein